jgi:hypothetical protein
MIGGRFYYEIARISGSYISNVVGNVSSQLSNGRTSGELTIAVGISGQVYIPTLAKLEIDDYF